MKQIILVGLACLLSWSLLALLAGSPREIFFGMLGPLVAVAVTWLLALRAHRIDPARVGPVLMMAFGAKLVFFGGYVVIAARVLELEVVAFAASFAAYFVALWIVQALFIRGLALRQAS